MAGMKRRHAVALTLVGWYLLYPPWNAEKGIVDPTLPLNRWYRVATFDSSADCEDRKFGVLEEMDKRTQYQTPEKAAKQERLRDQARCVSADDPHLREQ
jgi:hypothetical protein